MRTDNNIKFMKTVKPKKLKKLTSARGQQTVLKNLAQVSTNLNLINRANRQLEKSMTARKQKKKSNS